jgi:hypothetical protein
LSVVVRPVNAQQPQLSCIPAPTGLVSWWPADGNAEDIAAAGNSNGGKLLNKVYFAPGQVGQAIKFNGVDSFVQASSTGLPSGNDNRTMEMWVKVDRFVADEAFFAGYGSFGYNTKTYQLGTVTSRLNSYFSQWGLAIFGPSLQAGRWYHVAVSNVKNSVTLYLDGMVVGKRELPINTPQDTAFVMGRVPGYLGETRRLDGLVDEVSVYNRALSQSEIQSIFNASSQGKIGVGGFSTIIPSGSFVKCDNMFQLKGQTNGIKEMAIKKKKTDNDGGGSSYYQFKLIAKNINLTDKVSNLAKIDLKIGNDKGSISVRMNGHLGFNRST